MTKALSPEEGEVKDWLRQLGFETEPEPDWLGGDGVKRPEFWAQGPHDLWVEVKRVTPPPASQKGLQFHPLIKTTPQAALKTGHGLVAIEHTTTQQAVQWVVAEINAAAAHEQRPQADHHFVYVSDERNEIVASLSGDPPTTIRIRGPVGSKLPASIHLPQERWYSEVTVKDARGETRSGRFFEFFELSPVACVGRAQVGSSTAPFAIAAISSGDASNTSKLRSDFKNASRKFRDAVRVKPAPGIVVLVPDFGAVVTGQDVGVAAFGDLTVVLTPTQDRSGYVASSPFLHRNGALRGGSHSSITGIVVFYKEAKVIVLNRRATRPLDATSPLFGACTRALEWEV